MYIAFNVEVCYGLAELEVVRNGQHDMYPSLPHGTSASAACYSNASTSDTDYSNTVASEAVKAHNRGLAHIQK